MNRGRTLAGYLVIMIAALVVAACGGAGTPTATPQAGPPQRGLAVVDKVAVESPAAQATSVQVSVHGQLGDACTALAEVDIQRTAEVFVVTLATSRPSGAACAAVVSDFDKVVTLDTAGLPAGQYLVVANGVSTGFSLPGAVNPTLPAPSATPPPAPTQAPTEAAPPTATAEAAPTAAPTPAPSTSTTSTGTSASNCIDKAAFYADVTVPDNSSFAQGQKFVKTWKIRNVGDCVWKGYALVFAGGENMSGPLQNKLPDIQPGDIVDVSVNLAAPTRGGSYTGNWYFQNANGQRFGLGAERSSFLWVTITVDWGGQVGTAPSGGGASSAGAASGCGATRDANAEAQVLALINNARAAAGLPAYTLQTQLSAAAWVQSQDMACNDFISHTGSDGSNWYNRVQAQGYANYNSARENLYVGDPAFGGTPQGAFDWWMNSQIHHDNIMNANCTEIGIAYAYNPASTYKGYYTLVFARPWNP